MELQIKTTRQTYPDTLKAQITHFLQQHLRNGSVVAEIDKKTVAKFFQTNPELVARCAKASGVKLKKPERVYEPHDAYRKFIENNPDLTCGEIARKFGVSYHVIRSVILKFNLTVAEAKPYNKREQEAVPESINGFFNPSARLNWLI